MRLDVAPGAFRQIAIHGLGGAERREQGFGTSLDVSVESGCRVQRAAERGQRLARVAWQTRGGQPQPSREFENVPAYEDRCAWEELLAGRRVIRGPASGGASISAAS
ncbi:hypothetical protein BH23ACI1_BH23ACI1_03380 [soil metagenome]